MSDYYGQLNLTKLGEIVKNHPELVKEVTFKDGRKEKLININVNQKAIDDWGNAAYIKVPCKEGQKLDKGRYYISDLKIREEKKHIGGEKYEKREDFFPPENNKSGNDEFPF